YHLSILSFPTRRSSDLAALDLGEQHRDALVDRLIGFERRIDAVADEAGQRRALAERAFAQLFQPRMQDRAIGLGRREAIAEPFGDRKSTRLNSSHVKIS